MSVKVENLSVAYRMRAGDCRLRSEFLATPATPRSAVLRAPRS